MMIDILNDPSLVKSITKIYLDRKPVNIDITKDQCFDLRDRYKDHNTYKILKEKKTLFDYDILKKAKYVDMRVNVKIGITEKIDTRLSFNINGMKKDDKLVGVLMLYNSGMSALGKFPSIGCLIEVTTSPTKKLNKTVELDMDTLFIPTDDKIAYNRFVKNIDKFREMEEDITNGFSQIFYEIWLPILCDNFNTDTFKKYPQKPKKPVEYICTLNAENNDQLMTHAITERMMDTEISSPSDIWTKLMFKKPEKVEQLGNFINEVLGDSNASKRPNVPIVHLSGEKGREIMSKINAGVSIDELIPELNEIEKNGNYIHIGDDECTPSSMNEPESEPDTESSEPEPISEPEEKEYDDSLDGFFDMLNDTL